VDDVATCVPVAPRIRSFPKIFLGTFENAAPDFQSQASEGHEQCTYENSKFKGQSVGSKERVEENGRTDDCFAFPPNAVDTKRRTIICQRRCLMVQFRRATDRQFNGIYLQQHRM